MGKPIEHQMKFRVVLMTPEWAKELLSKNHPKNRTKKYPKINLYARDMRQGFWKLTPEPICVDEDGYLTNGQNRLEAVIESGCEVPMSLVTGCSRDSILETDLGVSRNAVDQSRICGKPLIHGLNEAGLIKSMCMGLSQYHNTLSVNEIIQLGQVHQNAINFAFECIGKNIKAISHSAVRAVIARSYYDKSSRNRTKQFCEYLISGLVENRDEDVAAIRLRNWLQDTFLKGQKQGRMLRPRPLVVYSKTEYALKAFHYKENIPGIRETKQELFPLPEELEIEKE